MTTTTTDSPQDAPLGRVYRALSAVERAGNRLPHPFWIFVILIGLLGTASAILSAAEVAVALPSDGTTVTVNNLLSVEGAQYAISSALSNYGGFAPLTMILVVLLGVSVAERSGLLTALLRITVGRMPGWGLSFAVALGAMIAHVMSDSAYLVMMPLGALAFRAAGRSPLLGLMLAYAATAVGFNASPLLTPSDAIRAALSTTAAQIVDPDYVVTPVATYFFTATSSVILAAAIALVVEVLLSRRPEFTAARLQDDFATADRLFNVSDGKAGTNSIALTSREKLGMTAAAGTLALCAMGIVLMLLPGSPFRGEDGSIVRSYVMSNIAVFISVIFALLGTVYGRITGSIPALGDVPTAMAAGVKELAPVLVLFFVVSQFMAYFTWTNIGSVVSVNGAQLLRALDAPHLVVLLVIVIAICFLNLLITSGSAMWSILAAVIVPLMMYVGIKPEAAMTAFMIGDSVTNCLSPLNGYFVLALGFVQQFRKGAGIGTLLSFTLPISIVVLVVWTAFFCLWYVLGLPLGPGVPIR